MLETQRKWYLPALTSLGWHVGCECRLSSISGRAEPNTILAVWNLVGGTGFTLCGALGYALNSSTTLAYQSACSTFWGGWAFLLGSVIQWYEAVNPVA
ncbi:hypothetical protein B0H15DRAFT_839936 [Mycena belliarum]|uniref:Uncharacterized protein n=1 Tax=Mycena belliarum TaxID=1033014 RepID=A0AAD6U8T9_9AGAR|nr:hypothetical protein B0H15DRAFT_839936 [Mycena belliae]